MSSPRPKLLLFSHICSPAFFTGAEKLLLSFAREMNRRFQCTLVVPRNGAIANAARGDGMGVRILDIPLSVAMYVALPHLGQELEALRRHPAWEALVTLLQEEKPDYVWVNTCVHPLPAMAAKMLGIPTIWALMETINPGSHRPEVLRIIDANSDRIVGISRSVLSPFPQELVSAKAAVLSPFIDREELQPDSWPNNRIMQRRSNGWAEHHRVVGYIASTIYQNKGLREFLRAVLPLAVSDASVRMLVVGNATDDDYMSECRELVRKAGLADRVAWIRFTPRIENVYPAMDLVVVPSLVVEGFGMAALEGMIFGKPVVSFASGGLTEIHEATGNASYLVPPGDVDVLSNTVASLLQNDALRESVGRRNASAAAESFGVEAFRRKLDAFAASLPAPGEPLPELVRGSGPEVYRIENGRKRPFSSPESLQRLGYRYEDVRQLPDERLALVPTGAPLSQPAGERPSASRRSGRRRKARTRMRSRTRARTRTRARRAKRTVKRRNRVKRGSKRHRR